MYAAKVNGREKASIRDSGPQTNGKRLKKHLGLHNGEPGCEKSSEIEGFPCRKLDAMIQ